MARQKGKKKRERLTITLGEGQKTLVEAAARKGRTTSSTVIRVAIDTYFIGHASNGSMATSKKTPPKHR